MRKTALLWVLLCATLLLGAPLRAYAETKLDARVRLARAVWDELMQLPEEEIPQKLVTDAVCIAVIPSVIKGAFIWGARYGRGVVSCRDERRRWSAPVFQTLAGGSFGLQIGISSPDLVLFFMTERGARSLLTNNFTFGGEASVAAGPVGRTAEAGTDLRLNAEIYSYARSKGLFIGAALKGERLAPNLDATTEFYGQYNTAEDILFNRAQPSMPESARSFVSALP